MPSKQLSAVTGRRVRPDYRGILSAKRAMLPFIKSNELAESRHQDNLAESRRRLKSEEDFAREQTDLQKKQAKKAQAIGAVQLGVDAYSGYKAGQVLDGMGGGGASKGFLDTMTSSAATLGQGNWWNSAKAGAAGGAMGGVAGGFAGASLLGDQMPEWLGGALGGGIGGALMSGGNIYGAIGGVIVGGGLGSFL